MDNIPNDIIYINLYILNSVSSSSSSSNSILFNWSEYWANEYFNRIINNIIELNERINWNSYFLNENYNYHLNVNEVLLNALNNFINENENQLIPINSEQYNENTINIKEQLDNCPICLEIVDNYQKIIKCEHKFCNNCLKKWLLENNSTCPICRIELNNK